MSDDYWGYREGEVRALEFYEDPPTSSLVDAFHKSGEIAAEAIVLRGYLGRSDIMTRTLDYLDRAKRIAEARASTLAAGAVTAKIDEAWADVKKAAQAARTAERAAEVKAEVKAKALAWGLDEDQAEDLAAKIAAVPVADIAAGAGNVEAEALAAGLTEDEAKELAAKIAGQEIAVIDSLIAALGGIKGIAKAHIPWRLYLTPRLDRYVDFHRSSLLAYRREAKAERQDACTVWLRIFEEGGRLPIPYRVVDETSLGPSFASWVGGELVDDYLEQAGSASTAWGDQSAAFGGKPWTGRTCAVFGGKPWTGRTCAG